MLENWQENRQKDKFRIALKVEDNEDHNREYRYSTEE